MATKNGRVGRLNNTVRSYPGHGDSDKPTNRYTLDGFATDVLAVADAAGAQRFVLGGFSMSGKFAQYIAAVHPEGSLRQKRFTTTHKFVPSKAMN